MYYAPGIGNGKGGTGSVEKRSGVDVLNLCQVVSGRILV